MTGMEAVAVAVAGARAVIVGLAMTGVLQSEST